MPKLPNIAEIAFCYLSLRFNPNRWLDSFSIWIFWQLSLLAIASFSSPLSNLLNDFRNRTCADRTPALADGEPESLFHGHRRNQLNRQRHVVARHHHLRA